jgi:hypothetical protein
VLIAARHSLLALSGGYLVVLIQIVNSYLLPLLLNIHPAQGLIELYHNPITNSRMSPAEADICSC